MSRFQAEGPAPSQARRDPTQRSLEARLRNARYLAELTKFRLAPAGAFFSLLKGLLDDFSGHNVDAAAALVETAGRFLFCLPETQTRISNMLDVGGLIAATADASHARFISRPYGQMKVPIVCLYFLLWHNSTLTRRFRLASGNVP